MTWHSKTKPQGFTLVELLLVLAIMAMAATLFMTSVRTGATGAELRAATREMAAALNETRSIAISRNQVAAVTIDPVDRLYRDPLRQHRVSPRVTVALSGLVPVAGQGHVGMVYFFPDGSSSGGEIAFTAGAAREAVAIDWFTGHAGAQDITTARR